MKRPIFAIMLAGLVLLTGLGFAVLSMSRPAPVDAHAMTAANELVAAGHYAEAARMYEQLIAQGAQDAALYYNLGNATLSLGDASRAAAAYEQAAVLAPRDADIRANLALAQQQARGQIQVSRPSALPLGGLADITIPWLTVDELALLAWGACFALGLLVFAYRGLLPERRPALLRVAVAAALLVVLASSGLLASRMATPRLAAPATIVGQQAAVPANPSNPM
jgi:tetratricopeptide (TPR) repeat protein